MKLKLLTNCIACLCLFMTMSCSSTEESVVNTNVENKTVTDYYTDARAKISMLHAASVTRGVNLVPNDSVQDSSYALFVAVAYAPYCEKFENVTDLSHNELSKINSQTPYKRLVNEFESSIDSQFSVVYDHMSVEDYKLCVDIIKDYLRGGGHDIAKIQSASRGMNNAYVRQLLGYSAAIMDDYMDPATLEIFNREIAVQKKSCEDIAIERFAILGVDVGVSILFSLALPPSFIGTAVTELYALASSVQILLDYKICVKRRTQTGNRIDP